MKWDFDLTQNGYGAFAVYANRPGQHRTEVTYFRGVPLKLSSYSFSDPFSDSTAEITFPQITPYDDLEPLWFVNEWTNYDIYWVPAGPNTGPGKDIRCIHPESGQKTLYLNYRNKKLLWEGFSVSLDPSDIGCTVQLQGALFQADRYLAKPRYVGRPIAMERLLKQSFSRKRQKLYTKNLRVIWPAGWQKKYVVENVDKVYKPRGVKPGNKWTGYATRNTGAWDRLLTGYCQDLLAQMYTTAESGVRAGNQWTIRKYPRRRPVLEVRDMFREPDFEFWYGTPGVDCSLSRDGMSGVNIIYGEGTGHDGVNWTQTQVSDNGRNTKHIPLAYDDTLWPYPNGSHRPTNPKSVPAETLIKFGSGVSFGDGIKAAEQMLHRDMNPGWIGSITIKVDPSPSMSRWEIKAGMTVRLRGYVGLRDGLRLHISEVVCSPSDGTVTLKVDTRYRDLLTLEQVTARVRDALTPVKMLQVNRRSVTIEDLLAPWDYAAGSGSIPKKCRKFIQEKPESIAFPWEDFTKKRPPWQYPGYYINVHAGASKSKKRWTETPLLMSQAGSAVSIKIMCVDKKGYLLRIPFHVSIYSRAGSSIPHTGNNYSPFAENHFYDMGPNGEQWNDTQFFSPDPSIVIGWGNHEQQAGYSPNRSSDSPKPQPTGLLMDYTPWTWNMSDNPDFDPNFGKDVRKKNLKDDNARQLWIRIYADDYAGAAYFIGRIIRLEPGV